LNTSTGDILISGTYTGADPQVIEAKWNGGAFETIVTATNGGTYSGKLMNKPIGSGTLTVRLYGDATTEKTVDHVGIGDVFIVAGQSNTSGRGTNNQSYTGTAGWATLFGNDYVWKALADPYDSSSGQIDTVSSDDTAAGSWIPSLASQIVGYGIPCAFVPCALGNTSITQWQPGASHTDRSTLYGSMVYRAQLMASKNGIPCKAILYFQGENDVSSGMAQNTYVGYFTTFAAAIATDLGIPIIPAKLPYLALYSSGANAAIKAAFDQIWKQLGGVMIGPDLTTVTVDGTNHIRADADLTDVATRFYTVIQPYFYIDDYANELTRNVDPTQSKVFSGTSYKIGNVSKNGAFVPVALGGSSNGGFSC
jgi:hypothetical protein